MCTSVAGQRNGPISAGWQLRSGTFSSMLGDLRHSSQELNALDLIVQANNPLRTLGAALPHIASTPTSRSPMSCDGVIQLTMCIAKILFCLF